MEYRGKRYDIVQSIEPGKWMWTIYLDGHTKSGTISHSRLEAIKKAEHEIDRALTPKK
jgi:hypothetical protein